MLPDPAEVVIAEGRAGHDQEALLGEARDGEVALDATSPVEHLRVDDGADGAVDVVGAEALQEGCRAGTLDLDLGEARLVEEGRGPARRKRFRPDRRRPVFAGPATRAERLALRPGGDTWPRRAG